MTLIASDAYRPPRRAIRRVFLHCSASDAAGGAFAGEALVEMVRGWHLKRGFSDVGYHWLIDRAGQIAAGRDLERIPAAQAPHNTGTLALMVHGLSGFTEDSLLACARLCAAINAAHGGGVTFHGHCEVSDKTCPVFDYRALLGLDRAGRMPLDTSRPGQVHDVPDEIPV